METMHEEVTDEIRAILEKWRPKEGNLIMILHGVQQQYGYVPWNIAKFLASELSVPLARIFEVITFYHFFNLEAPADYKISVCTGTACHLKGAQSLLQDLKRKLAITPKNQYTEDRQYKVEEVRCVGCCGLAPAIVVNDEVFGRLKEADIEPTLQRITEKENA